MSSWSANRAAAGSGNFAKGRGHDPQPPQRADRHGNREACEEITGCRDGRELLLGEGEVGVQRGVVDLRREAHPFRALGRGEDLDRHQKSISRPVTVFIRSASEGRL